MAVRPLPPALQKIARDELNEVPEDVKKNIEYLRDWINKHPHVKCGTDDQWLLIFLRGCKHNLDKTTIKLESYYAFRKTTVEFFGNRDPLLPKIQEFFNRGIFLPITTSDYDGPKKFLYRCQMGNPQKLHISDIIKGMLMMMDILFLEDDSMMRGQEIYVDLADVQYPYILQATPSHLKRIFNIQNKAYPFRIKGIHFLNTPMMFMVLYKLFKSLLPEKIANRVQSYSKEECADLSKIIPTLILPKDYNGDGRNIEEIKDEWKTKAMSYRNWFLEDNEYRATESKPPTQNTKSFQSNIEKSFKELDFD